MFTTVYQSTAIYGISRLGSSPRTPNSIMFAPPFFTPTSRRPRSHEQRLLRGPVKHCALFVALLQGVIVTDFRFEPALALLLKSINKQATTVVVVVVDWRPHLAYVLACMARLR